MIETQVVEVAPPATETGAEAPDGCRAAFVLHDVEGLAGSARKLALLRTRAALGLEQVERR